MSRLVVKRVGRLIILGKKPEHVQNPGSLILVMKTNMSDNKWREKCERLRDADSSAATAAMGPRSS